MGATRTKVNLMFTEQNEQILSMERKAKRLIADLINEASEAALIENFDWQDGLRFGLLVGAYKIASRFGVDEQANRIYSLMDNLDDEQKTKKDNHG